jgi:predicted dienelactone hydrolase
LVIKPYFAKFAAFSLGLACLFRALPARSAERLSFFYGPLGQFSLDLDDLEYFVETGQITDEFAFYANRATPEQLANLRNLLGRRFEIDPFAVYLFTRSPIGQTLVQRLSQVLQVEPNSDGNLYALRAAINQAVQSQDGLTALNILRQFPFETVYLDIDQIFRVTDEISSLFQLSEDVFATLDQQAQQETAQLSALDFTQLPDLREPGSYSWQKTTIEFTNPNRPDPIPADIYRPENAQNAPVIVISHGVASDRQTFAYLAEHLASHGFVVAVPLHPATSSDRFERFIAGFDTPPDPEVLINRPLDIQALLDQLTTLAASDPAWQNQLNLNQVGAIGQSLGAYTVLAVAGATLNFEKLSQTCTNLDQQITFNLSELLQCQALALAGQKTTLRDPRITAAIAINPFSSTIFGQQGLSQIQIPVMFIGGTSDFVTPALAEQICPFTWLDTPQKYLVLVENGTHFSFLQGEGEGVLPIPEGWIGPDPEQVYPVLQGFATAFMNAYLRDRETRQTYLNDAYAQFLSSEAFALTLVRSLSLASIDPAICRDRQ